MTPDQDGNWTFNFSDTPLAAGSYEFEVTEVFNGESFKVTKTLVINGQTPPPPTVELAESSQTGTADNETSQTTPTLSGTGVATSTVNLKFGDLDFIVNVDSDGNWSKELPTLTAGTYEYRATTLGLSGLPSAEVSGSIEIVLQNIFTLQQIDSDVNITGGDVKSYEGRFKGMAVAGSEVFLPFQITQTKFPPSRTKMENGN